MKFAKIQSALLKWMKLSRVLGVRQHPFFYAPLLEFLHLTPQTLRQAKRNFIKGRLLKLSLIG